MRTCKDCSVELTNDNSCRSYGLLCGSCKSHRVNAKRALLAPESRAQLNAISRDWYRANREYSKGRARAWQVENKGRRDEYMRTWQSANRDQRRDYLRAWQLANRAAVAAAKKRKYDADPAANMAKSLAWNRAHPERKRVVSENRRVQKITTGRVTAAEWLAILDRFNHACGHCLRSDETLTMDHVIALSRGGRHEADNIVPLCKSCNCSKREWGVLGLICPTFRLAA